MLITPEQVQSIPGFGNLFAVPISFLNQLIGYADGAVKRFCKQNLELASYVEYYNGSGQRDQMTRQYPVWVGNTTVAAGSNGAALPQATINVASTVGFCPGVQSNDQVQPPTLCVQTGTSTYTAVTYTGTTSTTFTGCSGGTGTLATGYTVNAPVAWYDPTGYWGTSPSAFADGTLQVFGTQWAPLVDGSGVSRTGRTQSRRGLLRRIGGSGPVGFGPYPQPWYQGKLAGFRAPCWPTGDGSVKVAYSAGWTSTEMPYEIQYATAATAAYMMTVMMYGRPLNSESLGQYSYSLATLNITGVPDLGSVIQSLIPFRESSWGYP